MVDVASLDTGNADRDAHVLSDELLDVSLRPTLTFVGHDVMPAGDDWTLRGELTIGDVTRPLELDVEFGGIEAFPSTAVATPASRPLGRSAARTSGSTPDCWPAPCWVRS